jgi:glucokinase
MKTFIGIEIGGTKLQIVSGDELGNVGFGGPVDRKTGKIWTSYHVNGWSGFELVSWLKHESKTEVVIDNDANVAALSEATIGAGKTNNTVFYATLGSGVGAGLVINKKIYHGSIGGELEFGHIRLDRSSQTLQSSCSGWAVNEKIRTSANRYPDSILAELAKQATGEEAKILSKAIEMKDESAIEIFEQTMDDLAFGLSHVVHLVHPNIVILGGGLSAMGEVLRLAVSERLVTYVMDAFQPGLAEIVKLSALKENAVPCGALLMAANHINSKH